MILDTLIRQLLPRGRAFKFPEGGNAAQTIGAVNEVYGQGLSDAVSILDAILPDTETFTESDASVWEARLGLPSSSSDLETRKTAIMRKLTYPGECLGRLSKTYLEAQLRAAGFDVYVHKNRFSDGTGGWTVVDPGTGGGGWVEHGVVEHGVDVHGNNGFPYNSVVSNHQDKAFEPAPVYTATELRHTFFIGGYVFPNFATVPSEREAEFRKLILTLKAQHTVAYLLINYV